MTRSGVPASARRALRTRIEGRGGPRIDALGWLAGTVRVLSPHRDARPDGTAIRLLVIHAISLPPGEFGGPGIEQLFTNRLDPTEHPYYAAIASLRVSAHFLIRRDGSAIQFVPCAERAWHAGQSTWCGLSACNDFSLGIELEGTDTGTFTNEQYRTLGRLTRALIAAYPLEAAVGHSDIAPGRKTDPGPGFDWARYRRLAGCRELIPSPVSRRSSPD